MKTEYILIIAGALLAILIGVFLLMSRESAKEEAITIEIPQNVFYAFGEATAGSFDKAEEMAKKKALSKISEQIYVELTSSATLVNAAMTTVDTKVRSMVATAYEKEIKTQSNLEVVGYSWKVLKREKRSEGYYVKGIATIDKAKALKYLQIYTATKIAEKLLQNDMIFSAKKFLDFFRQVVQETDLPPKITGRFTEVASKLMERWKDIDGIVKELDSREPLTSKETLEYLELVEKLKRSCADVPPELLEKYKKKVRENLRVSLSVVGPEEVVKGQYVDLEVLLDPAVKGVHTFHVIAKDGDFPSEVSLEDGRGILSGVVKGEDLKVEVNMADVIVGTWSPGSVLPVNLKNVLRVALKELIPLFEAHVVAPRIWREPEGELSLIANDYLLKFGYGVDTSSLLEKFEKIDSRWSEDVKVEKLPLLRLALEGDSLVITGDRGVKLKVETLQYVPSELEREVRMKLYKILIASGNPEAVPKELTGDGEIDYLVAVSYYLMGNLGKSAEILESIKSEYPKSYILLSRVYFDMGEYIKSIETGKEYVSLGRIEGTDQIYRIMALDFAKVENPNVLIRYLRWLYKIVKTVKDCDSGYYAVAFLLRKFGNPEEALEWITKALDVKPKEPLYLMEYASILKDLGEIDKAKEILKELESMDLSPSLREKLEKLEEEIGS